MYDVSIHIFKLLTKDSMLSLPSHLREETSEHTIQSLEKPIEISHWDNISVLPLCRSTTASLVRGLIEKIRRKELGIK